MMYSHWTGLFYYFLVGGMLCVSKACSPMMGRACRYSFPLFPYKSIDDLYDFYRASKGCVPQMVLVRPWID